MSTCLGSFMQTTQKRFDFCLNHRHHQESHSQHKSFHQPIGPGRFQSSFQQVPATTHTQKETAVCRSPERIVKLLAGGFQAAAASGGGLVLCWVTVVRGRKLPVPGQAGRRAGGIPPPHLIFFLESLVHKVLTCPFNSMVRCRALLAVAGEKAIPSL